MGQQLFKSNVDINFKLFNNLKVCMLNEWIIMRLAYNTANNYYIKDT